MHLLGHKRKIGKKTYKAVSSHEKKSTAQNKAKAYRNRGYSTLVVANKTKEHGKEYYVWREMK